MNTTKNIWANKNRFYDYKYPFTYLLSISLTNATQRRPKYRK